MDWQNKHKKRNVRKPINLLVPFIIGLFAWFITEMFINCKSTSPQLRFMNQKGYLRIPDSDMFVNDMKYY